MTGGRPEQSDGELLASVAGGDRAAFDELYARHFAWLHLRLSRRCADPALVEETIQDRFLTVWERPRPTPGRATWAPGCGASVEEATPHQRTDPTEDAELVDGQGRSDRSVRSCRILAVPIRPCSASHGLLALRVEVVMAWRPS